MNDIKIKKEMINALLIIRIEILVDFVYDKTTELILFSFLGKLHIGHMMVLNYFSVHCIPF